MDLFGVGKKKPGKPHTFILLLLIAGLGFMLLSKWTSSSPSEESALTTMSTGKEDQTKQTIGNTKLSSKKMQDYEKDYENQLKEMIEHIHGVGKVEVMVSLETSEKKLVERNKNRQSQTTNEEDKNGGKRTIEDVKDDDEVVMVKNGDREEPIITSTEKPAVRGVLVVAEGAENIEVKAMIIDAVTKVFNIGSNRVSVEPKKSEGE